MADHILDPNGIEEASPGRQPTSANLGRERRPRSGHMTLAGPFEARKWTKNQTSSRGDD